MRRPCPLLVCAIALSLAAFGCKRLSTGAREEFGKAYSCPEDRVEVKARDDLTWSSLLSSGPSEEVPPDDVAKDPARRAKWQQDRDDAQQSLNHSVDSRVDVYQAIGCGHDVLMGCWHPGGSGGRWSASRVTCNLRPPKR